MPDMSKPENQKPPGGEVPGPAPEPAKEPEPPKESATTEPTPEPTTGQAGTEKDITITFTRDEWLDVKDVIEELLKKIEDATG